MLTSKFFGDNFKGPADLPPPTQFIVKPNENIMATKDDILQALEDQTSKIVDCRDSTEWIGISSSPYGVDFCPRKGRIRGKS